MRISTGTFKAPKIIIRSHNSCGETCEPIGVGYGLIIMYEYSVVVYSQVSNSDYSYSV